MIAPAAISALGALGLAVVAVCVVLLLISVFHPEGRRRPGGYLDGQAPQPDELRERDAGTGPSG